MVWPSRSPASTLAAGASHAVCSTAAVAGSVSCARRGLNVPKILRMTLTAGLFFITPALQNLDVAFPGPEHWHSFPH